MFSITTKLLLVVCRDHVVYLLVTIYFSGYHMSKLLCGLLFDEAN